MSKIYKAVVYIEDINEMYRNLEDIKCSLETKLEDVTFSFDKEKVYDTTKYLEKVGDFFEWNTTDENKRILEMEKFIKEEKDE